MMTFVFDNLASAVPGYSLLTYSDPYLDGSKSVPGRRLFRVFRLLSSPNASKSHRVKKNGRSFIPSDGVRDERLESMHLYYRYVILSKLVFGDAC
ncbi:LOW QUALITY PROTEIN: hypothetical protein BC938DRAFT_480489 [Jimgerdemannia flammicorona]|uniref:Uncharacterized protein n=1 Tax=Jimgerdemannia flammicorona TaxID=994334 RepID=A0A433QXE9_9FUNG|nr:LOW QUALITY PROTEIN: hypothetical protein BC938DRAFT_480489 [Jimgerdemannia flammicorona]